MNLQPSGSRRLERLRFCIAGLPKAIYRGSSMACQARFARPFWFGVTAALTGTQRQNSPAAGPEDYPVFTDKTHTDLSYEACMQTLLSSDRIYCQFATHNARSVAHNIEATKNRDASFELQKLHGMGDLLYTLVQGITHKIQVRTYNPWGNTRTCCPIL